MINDALIAFIGGANPVLEFNDVGSGVNPVPTPSDMMEFDWKAWLTIQVILEVEKISWRFKGVELELDAEIILQSHFDALEDSIVAASTTLNGLKLLRNQNLLEMLSKIEDLANELRLTYYGQCLSILHELDQM